jgi:hypothetical protein
MPTTSVDKQLNDPDWLVSVERAVGGLRYGSVEVLVHDGRVVQIETREKVRFEDRPPVDRRRNETHEGRAHRKAGGTATTLNLETNE